jgi:hypothetical protein
MILFFKTREASLFLCKFSMFYFVETGFNANYLVGRNIYQPREMHVPPLEFQGKYGKPGVDLNYGQEWYWG